MLYYCLAIMPANCCLRLSLFLCQLHIAVPSVFDGISLHRLFISYNTWIVQTFSLIVQFVNNQVYSINLHPVVIENHDVDSCINRAWLADHCGKCKLTIWQLKQIDQIRSNTMLPHLNNSLHLTHLAWFTMWPINLKWVQQAKSKSKQICK